MAYTKIHGIKTTLNKALAYIENPKKTEGQMLIYGYNTDPLCASIEFEMTAALAKEIKGDYTKCGGANNLAYHMIQSFAPFDKVTPEEAHKIGQKWADEILQSHYEYVLTTHVDKGHIHNHIIFNSYSFYDYKKYDNYKVAGHLREVSDRLCADAGLYVIKDPNIKQKSPRYYEWKNRKAGTSWKAQIKVIIDKAIAETTDYESFKAALKAANVEIKEGKRISFIITGTGQEKFCRGDKIGESYSREGILKRLAEPKVASYDQKIERQSRRTKIAATKELADALLTIRKENIQHESEFGIKVNELLVKVTDVKGTLSELESKNQQYKDAAKYLIAYRKYLPIQQEAEKQSMLNKKRFLSKHESELAAFNHAAAQLKKLGVNTNVDPDKVMNLVKDQDRKISELAAALKEANERINEIRKAHKTIESISSEEPEKEQKKQDQEIE